MTNFCKDLCNSYPSIGRKGRSYATGKRKNSIARVWVSSGTGKGQTLSDNKRKKLEKYEFNNLPVFRGFIGLFTLFCFVVPRERYFNFYKTNRLFLHFKRCVSGLIAIVAIFIGLRNLPLATVVSISFAAPIFATIMSIFFLNEKVGLYRWLAVIIGFIGILVISEHGFSSF